jgi:hypothetical protein
LPPTPHDSFFNQSGAGLSKTQRKESLILAAEIPA